MTAWFFWQLVPNAIPTNARVLLIVVLTFLALPVVTYLIGLFEHRKDGWFTFLHLTPRIILVLAILLAINVVVKVFVKLPIRLGWSNVRMFPEIPCQVRPSRVTTIARA